MISSFTVASLTRNMDLMTKIVGCEKLEDSVENLKAFSMKLYYT